MNGGGSNLPVRLPVSVDHGRNLTESILKNQPTLSGIETAVRGDTLCQLALIAVRQKRRLRWDPQAETFPDDTSSNALLQPRIYRSPWRLPAS